MFLIIEKLQVIREKNTWRGGGELISGRVAGVSALTYGRGGEKAGGRGGEKVGGVGEGMEERLEK